MENIEKLQKVAKFTVKAIGEFLDIPCPERYVVELCYENETEGLLTSDVTTNSIIIKCRLTDEPLSMFCVLAHELRHIYQHVYHNDEYFSNYTLENMHNLNEYCSQLAEIDANAFYCFLCETILNVGCPPIEEISKNVMNKIEARAIELFHEYYDTDDFIRLSNRIKNNKVFEIYRENAKKYQ